MTSMDATVLNEYGIHCRPSAVIAKAAQEYAGDVTIRVQSTGAEANAKSLLLLMGLGIKCGEVVTVSVSGPDEETECQRFADLVATNFDFARET